jgi:hypothetical protein
MLANDRPLLLGFFLHAFFEGYFVLYHALLAGSQSVFAQLWKEYALSDSRYMTSDPFMLCIESLTVVSTSQKDAQRFLLCTGDSCTHTYHS